MLRRQLPVHSPLTLGALLSAGRHAGADALEELRGLLTRRFAADRVLLTDSGTHALQLALSAAPGGERGRIGLPAFSCFDLATALVGAGRRVAFYDLDPETLAPEPESFRSVVERSDVHTVVVAPLFGHQPNWAEIRSWTQAEDVLLIEDAAQSTGASFSGTPAGSFGDATILSFGRGKGWTGGGGGALLLRSSLEVRDPATIPHPAGGPILAKSAAQWALGRPSLYWIPAGLPGLALGETVWKEPSTVRAMAPASASLILATDPLARREAEIRREHARRMVEELEASAAYAPDDRGSAWVPGGGYLRLPVLLERGMETFRHPQEARRLGIESSYPTPLPELPAVRRPDDPSTRAWPGAATLATRLVTLPTHARLSGSDLVRIVALLGPGEPRLVRSGG